MGILRYFLAIVVVFSHSPATGSFMPLNANGGLAVESFFVISGFYMSLIIEKYQLKNFNLKFTLNFYASRFLRIYPIYFFCLIITIMLFYGNYTNIEHDPIVTFNSFKYQIDKIIYAASNVFIFGQDIIRFAFFDYQNQTFVFFKHFSSKLMPAQYGATFSILGQAWSLATELTFYLLVPFILTRSTKLIVLLFMFTLSIKVFIQLYIHDLRGDAFFPSALCLFLLGSISHRLLYQSIKMISTTKRNVVTTLCVVCLVSYIIFIKPAADVYDLKYWSFIILISISIPYIFYFSKTFSYDKKIGELSYPIYITHLLCLNIVATYCQPAYIAYSGIAVSTFLSLILVYVFIKPIDYFRHNKFLSQQTIPESIHGQLATATNK